MLLMVSASAATSPLAFTVSFCVSSPFATAVTTLTMPRTCSVRLAAITLTLSVRSFQVPATPGTSACPPTLPSVPTSRAPRALARSLAPPAGHFCGKRAQLFDHGVECFLELQDLAAHVDCDFFGK